MAFQISEKSKKYISRNVGMNFDAIISKSANEVKRFIESKIGSKIDRPISDSRITSRGSAYVHFSRYSYYNTEDLNNKIDALELDEE
ncbi:MAG: hypothetical protein SNG38_06365 [Rikenellaceae bacterium]